MEYGVLALQTLRVFGWFCLCVFSMLAVIIVIRACIKVPDYVFRKLLHSIAFGMSAPIVFLSESWQASAACLILIMLLAFIALTFISRFSWYSGFFVEKEPGEIRTSMVLLLVMLTVVTVILWCFRGEPAYAVTAIFMWGMGDAFAAIIGQRFGKHRIKLRIADGKKTAEGTAACFAASLVTGVLLMTLSYGFDTWGSIVLPLAAAAVCAFVEMVCRRGTDTFFVPIAVTAVLLVLG